MIEPVIDIIILLYKFKPLINERKINKSARFTLRYLKRM